MWSLKNKEIKKWSTTRRLHLAPAYCIVHPTVHCVSTIIHICNARIMVSCTTYNLWAKKQLSESEAKVCHFFDMFVSQSLSVKPSFQATTRDWPVLVWHPPNQSSIQTQRETYLDPWWGTTCWINPNKLLFGTNVQLGAIKLGWQKLETLIRLEWLWSNIFSTTILGNECWQ